MKKLFGMLMAVVLMVMGMAGSAAASSGYMDGYMIVEIDGVEYELLQEVTFSTEKTTKNMRFVCLDEDGDAFFHVSLYFGDEIRVGTSVTGESGYPVSISLYGLGTGFCTYKANKARPRSAGSMFTYDHDIGYLEMYVENRSDDGWYYDGYFGAILENQDGYGEIEIVGGFVAEV